MDLQNKISTASESIEPSTPPNETVANRESPRTPVSTSAPTLRFPRPSGSQVLAHWVSHNSDPDISMSSGAGPNGGGRSPALHANEEAAQHLADSAYELISSVDGESQDGRATTESESAYSLDYARPDDVRSLAGTEHTYDDDTPSEDEAAAGAEEHGGEAEAEDGADHDGEDRSRSSSIRYAEQVLGSPSTQQLEGGLPNFGDQSAHSLMNQSIEFEEADGHMYLDGVSVKHTIRGFDEVETAAIAANMKLAEPPKTCVAAIRQTMSQKCLSSREPLRVLYVGSPAARREIVYKISSALYASASSDRAGALKRENSDGVYNIVPISSGDLSVAPEVELMTTSAFQIKVEDCISADRVYDGEFFPEEAVYAITIRNENGEDKVYQSAYYPSGSVVLPRWSLPHIAVFFVTEGDPKAAQTTRDAAWEFMTRHAIPSIFISHAQTFSRPEDGRWRQFVNQHAIHLCLESRDVNRTLRPERLPIDLASFLNIDARQMNRNLAYLTGLHEAVVEKIAEEPAREDAVEKVLDQKPPATVADKSWEDLLAETAGHIQRLVVEQKGFLIGVFLSLLLSSAIMFGGISSYSARPATTVVQTTTVATTTTVSSLSTVTTSSIAVSTVTINLTQTKTVKVTPSKESATSLSIPPSKDLTTTSIFKPFGGIRADKAQEASTDQESVCSTEVFSNNEILLKIPLSTKTSWLAKDSIFIDVYRDDDIIKTKFSSIDEGILIEIPKKEAYGILNVSVTTTRKPKVNETFEVNFGKPIYTEAFEKTLELMKLFGSRAHKFSSDMIDLANSHAQSAEAVSDKIRDKAAEIHDSASHGFTEASKKAREHMDRLDAFLASEDFSKQVRKARNRLMKRLRQAEDARDRAQVAVVQAQVNSYLFFLKLRGKNKEYADYAKRAAPYIQERIRAAEKAKKLREDCARYGDCGQPLLWNYAGRPGGCNAKGRGWGKKCGWGST